MSQAAALYHLQQIDLQLLRTRKRLDELVAALKDDKAVSAAQTQLDSAQKKLTPLKARMRDLELEIQSTQQKAKSTEERLYSGTVKNPKELQEMQQEIAALKKRDAELEDTLLEIMMSIEEAEGVAGEAQTTLTSVTGQWENQHRSLLDEQAELQAQLSAFQDNRKLALGDVKPESLKIYDNMKTKKANQPVALLQNRACSICGIEQTMAIEIEVRRGQTLVNCLNCGRILLDSQAISQRG